ncbi:homeobox-leucine zipper protein HOX11 isoform X2 [Dendrobium catenatum]|uniref:Homeobox-leucine zipper protein HOX11 n=1 Tax=Dendrobium catenatum TaxID=906689 RepID=A0A2I0XAN1_9ASPA|nr:homeobox-leucine zipper protein HOX11 isoform X2 [Dendrobium catenatum]PKU84944.1 Homeobox-leucine zipper protein HOX11 [Dendrobium catenatum]
MELTLSLGESTEKALEEVAGDGGDRQSGFCMGLGFAQERRVEVGEESRGGYEGWLKVEEGGWSVDPPVQLNLLPLAPIPRLDSTQLALPWSTEDMNLETPPVEEEDERAAISSSPIRMVSSLHMNFASGGGGVAVERASSRGSDEEENDKGRKKLRLSKEQSAFLEESFKEQNTLNPKLKFVLAKQLNLRPRQIEVWFQNRRARSKLKQMEIDCEFLKRRCEMLREENSRLHKEVTELRAIKSFHIQVPPTTLSICPSCERVSPPASPPQSPPTPR